MSTFAGPPTVRALECEVAGQCGVALAEVGLYLRGVDQGGVPVTPAILQGLRKGAKCCGVYLANPLSLADADAANLSPFAVERVLAEGLLFALELVLLHWHRAVQREMDPVAPAPMQGGWLLQEKQAVRDQVARLRALCAEPYREPADPIVVSNAGDDQPFGHDPYGHGYGYGYGYGHGWGGYW